MVDVLYAQSAQTDMLEAWLFIAEENIEAADRVIDTLQKEAKTEVDSGITVLRVLHHARDIGRFAL